MVRSYGADSTIIFMGRAGSLDTTQSPIYLEGALSLARLLAPVKPTRHGARARR